MGKNSKQIKQKTVKTKPRVQAAAKSVKSASSSKPTAQPAPKYAQSLHGPKLSTTKRRQKGPEANRKPQSSKTLMRQTVKKPAVSRKRQTIRVQADISALMDQPVVGQPAEPALTSTDAQRLKKAEKFVKKSGLISRFGSFSTMQDNPSDSPDNSNQPEAAEVYTPALEATLPMPEQSSLANMLQQAVEQATSHEQRPHEARAAAKRTMNLTLLCAVVLLLVAYLAMR